MPLKASMLKTKTFWGGLAAIATGVSLIVTGDVAGGVQLIGTGIVGIFIRDAITKVTPQ